MAEIEFTPEQMAELRARLGFPEGERDPDPDDLLVVIDAQRIVEDEAGRWMGLE